MTIHVRPATREDMPMIASFIRELAEYERLSHAVRFDEQVMALHLFGPNPAAEVLIGEYRDEAQGFALFFPTFSTFEGKPGIWLEDLYVRPSARGAGLGKALLHQIAKTALKRGCARFEWSVLEWNEPALGFYRSLGTVMQDDWRFMRLEGEALSQLGASVPDRNA
ncbi:diamine acetyltransferase [Croceicoccus estronivorus]|uniref:GNAT family N-acetyltransferase n=1 Tax=Croceicoccus estronivorus TaxID=1172626 RepID=UPI00082BD582|nr:GNAT family N-acetyltransferase [Croceicoccus estronivorus]OCC25430.1 diamine acetyltransferase [Croceicoccus estronivorus]